MTNVYPSNEVRGQASPENAMLPHAPTGARFLVRFRLHLLLSGRHADRPAGRASRRLRALPAIPAGADLQGAGLDHLAVQPLSRQGPQYVARPRAAVRGLKPAVP